MKPPKRALTDRGPQFDPTPEEIHEASQAIQAGWSDAERAKRAGQEIAPHWQLPRVCFEPMSTEATESDSNG